MKEDIWIEQVEIINFQSHKHTVVDFVKGTNALVGDSNNGKTAVIRAIRWNLLNIPNGTKFIKNGEEEATVKVRLSNKKTIVRKRSRGNVNLYELYEGTKLLKDFTGFGSKVPPEIQEAHGMHPIAGDIYFQIAEQIEGPFMLSLKPKQRAEVLGNLEELNRIDRALEDVNDDVRANNKNKKALEKEEKQLLLAFTKLKSETDRLDAKIDTLKELKKGIESKLGMGAFLEKQFAEIKKYNESKRVTEEEVEQAKRIIECWSEDLEERVRQHRRIEEIVGKLKSNKQLLESIKFMQEEKLHALQGQSEQIEKKIEQFQSLSYILRQLREKEIAKVQAESSYSETIAGLDYSHIDAEITKYQILYDRIERLRKYDQEFQGFERSIKEATERIDQLLMEFVDALHNAKICPTCGQNTNEVCTHTLEMAL